MELRFTGKGISVPGFGSEAADHDAEARQVKLLVEISRRIQAVSAAVIAGSGRRCSLRLSIGITDAGKERMVFDGKETLVRRFLAQRMALIVNEELDGIAPLAQKLTAEDLRFMKRAAFVPLDCGDEVATLFFAFPGDRDWTIEELIRELGSE